MAFENEFLDRLDAADAAALQPALRRVELTVGQVLVEQEAAIEAVHFPAGAQLANVVRFSDGGGVETSVIGREGVSGLAPFMADQPCAWEVAVRAAGPAWTAPARVLRALSAERPGLRERLLLLTHFYQAQAAQSAACSARHRVRPRVARWLLTAADLEPEGPVRFTQEEFATLLGVQRTSVSAAVTQLKAMGAVRHLRNVITIQDRGALEREACECYQSLRRRAQGLGLTPD
jgi:CRP-like cAMP-binding protein